MKKLTSLLLILALLLGLGGAAGFAAEEQPDIADFELPKPAAPHYMMYEAADRNATEGSDALYIVRRTDMSVLELSAEEYADRDAFLAKYGLYDFTVVMQYDTSLDGTDRWNHNPDWDANYTGPDPYQACAVAWIGEDMMNTETVFDLYACEPGSSHYSNMQEAIIHRAVPDGDYTFDNYYFDHENHSLAIRCRYFMQWNTWDGETVGDTQVKFSEWSDPAIFGVGSTAVTPGEPTGYQAPVIANLAYTPPTEYSTQGQLTYELTTPESVWEAAIYYTLTGDGYFDILETEISVDGSDWQPYETVNGWGTWALSNGVRTASADEPALAEDSEIKLRVRYTGSHGVSDWSNEISLTDGGTQQLQEAGGGKPAADKPGADKCGICGFCPAPLGICILIWLALALALLLSLVILLLALRPRRCRKCGAKMTKKQKFCPECGAVRGGR